MAYVIMRTDKYKTREKIAGIVGHHLRIPGSKLDNVDPSRSHLNVVIGAHDRDSFNQAVRDRIATCTRKPRPDANKVVEMLLGASPEFFEGKSYDEQKAYLYDCLDYAKGVFGEANIVGAYMHFDESTPHLSILAVPIETSIRKTKKMEREVTTLNASHFFAGKEDMIQMQTDVALFVQGRGHDLLRGEPKTETRREHEPLGQYWKKKALEAEQAGLAAADLLNEAAITNKAVSDVLDHVAKQANKVDSESVELAGMRAELEASGKTLADMQGSTKRLAAGLDLEWKRLQSRVAEVDTLTSEAKAEADTAKSANKEAQVRLASAKIAEKDALFNNSWANEEREFFMKMLPSWHEFRKVREILNKFGSKTLALLNFVHQNPKVAEILELARQDPAMFETVRASVTIAKALGPGGTPADTTDYGINHSAAKVFAGFVEEQWPNGDGLGP